MSHSSSFSRALRVIALGTLMLGSAEIARADQIAWQSDLRKAAIDSEKSSKPMLLKFTASWCGYCRKMHATTFRDERIIKQLNGCFIPVSVDADRNTKLKEALHIEGLPTTVIISPKFQVMKTIVGYQSADELTKQLGGLCRKAPPQPSASKTVAESQPGKLQRAAKPAFDGLCLVSMLDERRIQKGDAAFSLTYRNKRLFFETAAKRKAFETNPQKYWPGNDGYCVVTRQKSGEVVDGNPRLAAIYRRQVWFFAGPEQRKAFAAKPTKFAARQTARRK